jgi:AcrR family transcriptional regulator
LLAAGETSPLPAVARTSREHIIEAARTILEREGADGLTMSAVAVAVGVRAPSLYKHVADRGDLVRLVLDATVADLGERLRAVPDAAPAERIAWLAHEFRAFGHERPAAFGLMFAALPDRWRASPAGNAEAVRPLVDAATDLVGADHALDASRTMTAACVGFVSMELADAFRMGGSVDAAWGYLVETLVRALSERGTGAQAPMRGGSSRG